ncbi:MAG: hypothetical protein P8186_16245, partial [Anaerolineae bacterium]
MARRARQPLLTVHRAAKRIPRHVQRPHLPRRKFVRQVRLPVTRQAGPVVSRLRSRPLGQDRARSQQ